MEGLVDLDREDEGEDGEEETVSGDGWTVAYPAPFGDGAGGEGTLVDHFAARC